MTEDPIPASDSAPSQTPARYGDTIIFPASLDPDAVSVVRRLNEAGLESYLVGGCVRDLLLGLIPKDFDISTEARPRQIRRVFRNSRIIGRRFKLAHIHFGQKIIEVATFRRLPEGTGESGSGDLLITRDNEFGSALEDVLRRDFTINALLFDVRTSEVLDYVGGVQDLQARTLRTIGDPAIRFAEDPVRMLRAVKFAARLRLHLDAEGEAALRASADLIRKSAPPRVLEEIYKLLTCGGAERALPLLLDYGLLERLMPEVTGAWTADPAALAAAGRALDLIDRGSRRVSNAFLLATLMLRPWHDRVLAVPGGDPLLPAHALFDSAAQRMNIPRRDVAIAKHLLLGLLRAERPRRSRRGRGGDGGRGEPLHLLYLATLAGVVDPEVHARSVLRLLEAPVRDAHGHDDAQRPGEGGADDEFSDNEGPSAGDGDAGSGRAHDAGTGDEPRRGRRRRRRGGRRRRGRGAGAGPADAAESGAEGREAPEHSGWTDEALPGALEGAEPGAPGQHDADEGQRGIDADHAREDAGRSGQLAPDEGRPPRRRRGRRGGRRRRQHLDGQPREVPAGAGPHGPEGEGHDAQDSGPRNSGDAPAAESGEVGAAHRAAGADGRPEADRGERSRRGRRRGRRSRGGQVRHEDFNGKPEREPGPDAAGGAVGETGSRTEAAPARHEEGRRGGRGRDRGRRGERRANAPAESRNGRRGGDRPRPDDGGQKGPGQRHPEDVEDFFDW